MDINTDYLVLSTGKMHDNGYWTEHQTKKEAFKLAGQLTTIGVVYRRTVKDYGLAKLIQLGVPAKYWTKD